MSLFRKDRPEPFPMDGEHEYNHAKYGRTWYNLKMRILHRDIRHERIMVTITGKLEASPNQAAEQKYSRCDTWTRYKPKQLESSGFRRAEGVPGYDSIIFWGVPVYVKIQDMTCAKIPDDPERIAEPTSATLYDYLQSNATDHYRKGLAKTALPSMDLQKLGMIGILAAGAVLGLMMMGVI